MKRPYFQVFFAIFSFLLGILVMFGMQEWRETTTADPISMYIADGQGLKGSDVLKAAGLLSFEQSIQIEFRSAENVSGSISVLSKAMIDNMLCCLCTIHVDETRLSMNEEELTENTLQERLTSFGEAAKLTGSEPILLLSATDKVSGTRLIEIFQILREHGMLITVR